MGYIPTREDDERLLEWLRLRERGLTMTQIAKATGKPRGSVCAALSRLDAEVGGRAT